MDNIFIIIFVIMNVQKIFQTLKMMMNIYQIFKIIYQINILNNKTNIKYNNNNITYTITTLSNQLNNNTDHNSIIDLTDCGYKLKYEYNISNNSDLIILKLDYYSNELITQKVEYEVYYSFDNNNKTKLNLSICENTKIKIYLPLNISKDDLNKYNSKSNLYNDICYIELNNNGKDKTLSQRQNEFNEKYNSICEDNCEIGEYDEIINKIECICYTKVKLPLISEIKINKNKLKTNFANINNIANFQLLKCSYLLFNKNNIIKNSSYYLALFLFYLNIISIFIFIFHDRLKIKYYINEFNSKNKDKDNNDENKINTIKKNKKFKSRKNCINKENILSINNNQKSKNKLFKKRESININLNISNKITNNCYTYKISNNSDNQLKTKNIKGKKKKE